MTNCHQHHPFLLAALAFASFTHAAHARQVLLISNGNNTIGEYNPTTGGAINAAFINGQGLAGPIGMALDSNNHLFVVNGSNYTVGQYDAATGATINATFISQDLLFPFGVILDRSNHLFVSSGQSNQPKVVQFNATTGATINANFVSSSQGIYFPASMALDGHNHLLVLEIANNVAEYDATSGATINPGLINQPAYFTGMALDALGHLFLSDYIHNTIGEYDAITGATINATFVNGNSQGLGGPGRLALDGLGHLFVLNEGSGVNDTVGEYDATTGATINSNLITGLGSSNDLLFIAAVPEPSSLQLLAGAAGVGLAFWRRRRKPLDSQ